MSDLHFDTLLSSKDLKASERWHPTLVSSFEAALKLDSSVPNYYELKKNLVYSLQYLEFVELECKELALSSVLTTMLFKTYVITGMSILEGLFSNFLKSNGLWNTTNLESLGTTRASETKFGDDKFIVKTEILRKVPDHETKMDLDNMIVALSRHHEVLGVDHLVYPALKRLKNLRNKVHLQKIEYEYDHDYNSFSLNTKKEMGRILHTILTSSKVTDLPEMFDFLKVNGDE